MERAIFSRESTRDPLVNRVFKNTYRLTGVISSGGMGMVYRGEHLRLQVPVAIKVLRRDLNDPEQLVERLRREARLQALVRHPGAIKILDLDETNDGVVFIVMEFCPGRSLARIIDAEAPLQLDRALDLAGQILDILGAAHEARIVHSDLKPENVMVETLEDGFERVRILDFGVATLLEDVGAVRADRPGRDALWGSPSYTAPEQALGRAFDARADVYAIGVLLYEMLAGHLPLDDDDIDLFYDLLVNRPPVDIQQTVPTVPLPVAQAIMSALAKLPSDRPRTARELKTALLAPSQTERRTRVIFYGFLLVLVFLGGVLAGRSFT